MLFNGFRFPARPLAAARLALFTLAGASSQGRAEYYNFNTQAGSDILYQEVRYPYWAQSTYNARYYNNVQDEAGHSVFFYSGTTYSGPSGPGSTGSRANGYIWSFWPVSNPVNPGDAAIPGWWNPPFYDVPSIGEGASGKVETTSGLAMTTNTWYASAMRVWRPTGNPANEGRVGQWLRDGQTGVWNHIATMNMPFAATKFDGNLTGFLEDFSNGNANPRRAEFRNIYYRKGTWQPATTFRPSTRQATEKGASGLMEDGSVGFFETCSGETYSGNMGPGAMEKTYTLATPLNPVFDPLVVEAVSSEAGPAQVHVRWNVPAASAPQFAYLVEVFPSTDLSGTAAFRVAKIDPDVRECLIPTPGMTAPVVRLTITDIFDRLSTPAVVTAAAAIPADPVIAEDAVSGLNYKYYETSLSTLPDFAVLPASTLKLQGAVNYPDLTVRKKHTAYAVQYSGYVKVPADGFWMFSLASCDGSRLSIDGQAVISNDAVHSGGSERSGSVFLKAGLHPVELQYFKSSDSSGDNDQLRLSWEGPGVPKTLMTESCWARPRNAGEPVVILTSPTPGATLPASAAPLAATVSANGNALSSVRFYNRETVWAVKSGTASPFTASALLGAGANHLKARLFYGAGSAFTLDSPPIDLTATQPILSPWNFSSIGQHLFQASAGYSDASWSMVGDGLNLVWQEISGDETIIARVAARPPTGSANSSQFDGVGFSSGWSGGVIFRENLSPSPGSELGSRYVALYKEVGGSTRLQSSDDVNAGGPVAGPDLGSSFTWLKLQRAGGLFTASLSTDGIAWTASGTRTMTTDFGQKMYVGLFTLARPSVNSNPHWWKFDKVSFASINGAFQITAQPQSRSVYAGSDLSLSATVSSNTPLSYQWKRDGVDIPGASSATLRLEQIQASDAGDYRVLITDGTSSLTSDPAIVTVKASGSGYPRAVQILDPVGYWNLNETAGPTAKDSIGTRNGTFVGTLTPSQAGPRPPAFPVFPAANTAIKFNGNGSRIEIPALNLNSNTVTMTAWIRRNGNAASFAGLLFSRAGNTVAGLTFGNSNELRYTWSNSGSTYNWNSGLVPPDGQWTFVALVIEPSRATIFMNPGTGLQSATNDIAHAAEEFDGKLCIGQDTQSSSRSFNGSMDEVAIFNHSLTASEIAALSEPPPAVSLEASTPGASEAGPVSGLFTLTRAGASVTGALTVNLALGGTAANGTDYLAVGNTLIIPAGATSITLPITPVADTLAEGPETVELSLAKGAGYYAASALSPVVTIQDLPMDQWRFSKFGLSANDPALTGSDADPDRDGTSNLLEYALNTDPALADPGLLPRIGTEGDSLTFTYRKNLLAPDLTWTVLQSTALGIWTPAPVTEETTPIDAATVEIKARVPAGGDSRKFLRLQITRP